MGPGRCPRLGWSAPSGLCLQQRGGIITSAGVLAYVSADDLEEALQRLDVTLLVCQVSGVRNVNYAGADGDREEDLPLCWAFTYYRQVVAN